MQTKKAALRPAISAILPAISVMMAPPHIDIHKSAEIFGDEESVSRSVMLNIRGK